MSREKECLAALLAGTEKPLPRLDWNTLFRIAEYSKAIPLALSRIKDRGEEGLVPPEILEKFRHAYKINAIRNTLLLEEFNALCSFLAKEDIRIMALKGIFLLYTVYKDCRACRRMEDVDILITEKDRAKVDRLLSEHGYAKLPDTAKDRKTAMYFKRDAGGSTLMPVHVHWHISSLAEPVFLLSSNLIDMNEIWNYSVPLDGDTSGFLLGMRPDHALLALCEHGLRHGFARLMLLYDIHLVIGRYESSLDWAALRETAARWGLTLPLHAGLTLCSRTFGTVLPEGFLRTLMPGGSLLEKYSLRYILQSDFPHEDRCVLLYFAMNRKFTQKIRLAFSVVFLR